MQARSADVYFAFECFGKQELSCPVRGISSAGRALRSHRRGQGFESPILHSGLKRSGLNWSAEAEKSLREVPFFVRPAVRRRIESMAQERQLERIDAAFYAEARTMFAKR